MHKIPIFAVMVGVPGSGKDAMAKWMKEELGFDVVSTKELRRELLGNEADQSDQALVFGQAYHRIETNLRYGVDTVFVATSCKREHRLRALRCADGLPCMCLAMEQTRDLDICLAMNELEFDSAPRHIVRKMWKDLERQPTMYEEGWHYIIDLDDRDQLRSMMDIREHAETQQLKERTFG